MALKMMQALWYESYGGGAAALKHVEVPVPTPSKDQVLLKIEAASINPADNKIQKGMIRPFLPGSFLSYQLVIMNIKGVTKQTFFVGTVSDVTGEVVEVGPGVTNFKAGDKVLTFIGTGGGGLAEYAVANTSKTVTRQSEISAAEAASLPIAGCTAYEVLTQHAGINLDGSGPRQNILITAASGGVGHYAVQLAKMGNTHVTATCGARNIDLVKSLGADEVLDYKTPEGAALKSPSGKKYDIVLECTTGTPWSIFQPNLSERGKVIDITSGPTAFATAFIKKVTFSKQKLVPLMVVPNAQNLEILLKLTKEGKLKTVIDLKYPLSKAEDAWAKCIDGHATGKIIVEA